MEFDDHADEEADEELLEADADHVDVHAVEHFVCRLMRFDGE